MARKKIDYAQLERFRLRSTAGVTPQSLREAAYSFFGDECGFGALSAECEAFGGMLFMMADLMERIDGLEAQRPKAKR